MVLGTTKGVDSLSRGRFLILVEMKTQRNMDFDISNKSVPSKLPIPPTYLLNFPAIKTCDIFSYQAVYNSADNIKIELLIQQKIEHDVIKDLGGFGRNGVANTGDNFVAAIDSFGNFSSAFFADERII
jgi:hypothetical protein